MRNRLLWIVQDVSVSYRTRENGNRPSTLSLFELLSAEDQPDIFMLAEILRGLGRFDEAIEKLLSIKADQSEVGMKALERARTGDSSVFLTSQDKSLDW